jgi:hypothetical protein
MVPWKGGMDRKGGQWPLSLETQGRLEDNARMAVGISEGRVCVCVWEVWRKGVYAAKAMMMAVVTVLK